jgi:hypothetical protein
MTGFSVRRIFEKRREVLRQMPRTKLDITTEEYERVT